MKKIAVMGATGYIGKSLSYELMSQGNVYELFLFSRSQEKLEKIFGNNKAVQILSYESFNAYDYDVIINCTGINSLADLTKNPLEIFRVTEAMDTMILSYLENRPKTLYINISTGAVYGDNFAQPVEETSHVILPSNAIKPYDFYSITKMYTEAKHRAHKKMNIVDLRVFSFFSRFVDTNAKFFMSEVADCIVNKKNFLTTQDDVIWDYITPKDLNKLIQIVLKKKKINDSFDVYSKKPISKFELLSFLEKKYGLTYSIKTIEIKNTGAITKKFYYSKNKKAKSLGYEPEFSSLEGIDNELKMLHV